MNTFVNCISQSTVSFDSLSGGGGCFGEKKTELQKNYHFQGLCFSKVSNVRNISASFGNPQLLLILTNKCLTIMVRSGTEINICS